MIHELISFLPHFWQGYLSNERKKSPFWILGIGMYSRNPRVCITSTARRSIGDQPPKSVLYDIIGSSSLTEFFPNASTHYTMAGG